MTARSKFFSALARCCLLSVAMAVLGLAWGCGELPSQATPDEGAKARIQKAQEANIKFLEKKEAMQRASKARKR